jgi:hypothetical protein
MTLNLVVTWGRLLFSVTNEGAVREDTMGGTPEAAADIPLESNCLLASIVVIEPASPE